MRSLLRRSALLAMLAGALLAASARAADAQRTERLLTLNDVDAQLAQLAGGSALDYIARSKIQYGVTGQYGFDDFFRRSAIMYGGFYFGRRLVDEATVQLKHFARSKAASAALHDEVKELTQDADTTGWTLDESIAVLRAAKKKDELTQDEQLYFLAMSALMAATVPVVRTSVQAAPDLMRTGRSLVRQIPDDFDIFEAPQVAASLNQTMHQLAAVPEEGTSLVESLVVLSRAFQAMSQD